MSRLLLPLSIVEHFAVFRLDSTDRRDTLEELEGESTHETTSPDIALRPGGSGAEA
jgi:hypothetical protein